MCMHSSARVNSSLFIISLTDIQNHSVLPYMQHVVLMSICGYSTTALVYKVLLQCLKSDREWICKT